MKNTEIKPYKLRTEDHAAHLYADKGDKTILKVYKRLLESTITALYTPRFDLPRAVLRKK